MKETKKEKKKDVKKEDPFEEEVWDLKRVFIGLVLFVLIGYGLLQLKNHYFPDAHLFPKSSVKGASAVAAHFTPIPLKPINVSEKMAEVQQEVTHLNVAEIASSSPQVQQILNQLKGLQGLPKSEAKQACERICSGF